MDIQIKKKYLLINNLYEIRILKIESSIKK